MGFRHALVRELLAHFARQAGYDGPLRVTTRREHFERICRRRKEGLIASERSAYAVTLHGRVPVVWIHVAVHRSIRSLADTCAHEAVHIAHGPDYRCETIRGRGAKPFDAQVRSLLRGAE